MATTNNSGKNSKLGRNLVKCAAYRASNTRFKNKLRRVTRCNGAEAALVYKEREYANLAR